MTRLPRPLLASALALPLAGCISFGPKPPPTLMSLNAAMPVQPGPGRPTDDAHAIAVSLPTTDPALATQRVMVDAAPHSIAYLKNAQWVAAPAILFRNLVAETITARTGRFVPDYKLTASQPDTRLTGRLVRFGLDGPARAVVVTFDGVLLKTGSTVMQQRRFSARVSVTSEDTTAVGAALDQAANEVAAQVADWTGPA